MDRPAVISLVPAAALLLVLGPTIVHRSNREPEAAVSDLAHAFRGRRYVEPRLQGFAYAPLATSAHGPSAKVYNPDVLIAAAGVREQAAQRSTPASLAALGVAHLVVAETDRAVDALEEAAALAPGDGSIQSDLAAAYLVRGRASERPDDLSQALEAAARAADLEPRLREASFNRALALEALSLWGEARRGWEDYLRRDPSSGWADEARTRLKALPAARERTAASPSALLDDLDAVLLPTWADAHLRGEAAAARTALDQASARADALQRLNGESLGQGAVAAIEAAYAAGDVARLRAAARGHRLCGEGRRAYAAGLFREADRFFADARDRLRECRSPYADWATLRLAAAQFQLGDMDASWESLDELWKRRRAQSPLVTARLRRLKGLIRARRGDLAASLGEYRAALAGLAHGPADDDTVALRFLVAENLDLLGERTEAWRHWVSALQDLPRVRDTRQWIARLLETALGCLRQGRPRAALHFMNAILQDAGEGLQDRTKAESYIHRARMRWQIGNRAAAQQDLASGAGWLAKAEEQAAQPRLRAELLTARGEILASGQPTAAVAALSEVLQFYEADQARWRLSAVHLARGRALVQAGELDLAEQDFLDGISIAEAQRSPMDGEQLRISFFALTGELFTELLALTTQRGTDPSLSFAIAERARARALLDRSQEARTLDAQAAILRLPPDTLLVTYAVLPGRLLVWRLSSAGCESWVEAVTSGEMARLVAAFHRELGTDGEPSPAAERLYDLLVRRALADSSATTLVVVPDGVVHAVSFPALLDRGTGRYLVEDRAVLLSPSATLFCRSSATARPSPGPRKVLVVGAPEVEAEDSRALPALPFARDEARAVAKAYPGADLLLGADATKPAFLELAARSEVVHFAGHARANGGAPFLSRLLLAPLPGAPGSGSLSVQEIARASFPRTRLVVLGACSTGAGPVFAGEGPISLARPFLAAGVSTVVASLWDVEDRAARQQLQSLHLYLAGGATPAQALRAAQLDMLASSDPSLRRPAAWGAFEVFAAGFGRTGG
jgi:CHAT domain-containing protein